MMKEEVTRFFVISMVFVFLAFFIQNTIVMSPDVSYLMHAAWELIQGGRYGFQIFETNPPMILYLYLPVHFFVKIFSWDIILVLRFYILFLCLLSSAFSFYLLKKVIPGNRFYQWCFLFTFLWVLFLLPIYAFGQREHLWVILAFPYILTMALFFENRSISRKNRFLIGLLASFGFALKPFFIIPFVFLEIYAIFKKRNLFAVIRVESFTIVGVIVVYLVSMFIWQPEYIHIILPFVFKYYFPFLIKSLAEVFLSPEAIFCFAVMAIYGVFYSSDHYKALGLTLWITLLGMMLAYLIPRQTWYYHLYPALGISYLLGTHCLAQLCLGKKTQTKILFLFLATIIFFVPVYNYIGLLKSAQSLKKNLPVLPIEAYINAQIGERSIFCFSLFTSDCFPLVYHTKTRYAERFSSFWWSKGIFELEKENKPYLEQDKQFLIESIAEDLNYLKARWVIVNDANFYEYLGFDIVHYFSQNEKFREAWKNYYFQKKIGRYQIYERKT